MQRIASASDHNLFVISDVPENLPLPYSDWVDPQLPLPPDVIYIPSRTGAGGVLLIMLLMILLLLPIASIVFILVALLTTDHDDQATAWFVTLFYAVSGFFASRLIIGYIAELAREVQTQIRMLRARSQNRLRYGLHLGPDALLVWLSDRCVVVHRDLIASASIAVKRSWRTTDVVIKLDFDDSIADKAEAWFGGSMCLGAHSLQRSPQGVVSLINKWLSSWHLNLRSAAHHEEE